MTLSLFSFILDKIKCKMGACIYNTSNIDVTFPCIGLSWPVLNHVLGVASSTKARTSFNHTTMEFQAVSALHLFNSNNLNKKFSSSPTMSSSINFHWLEISTHPIALLHDSLPFPSEGLSDPRNATTTKLPPSSA